MSGTDSHIDKSELIEKYLGGGLSPDEEKTFNKLRDTDRFFREAVEGLSTLDTDVALKDIYTLRKEKHRTRNRWIAVAAAASTIVVVAYLAWTLIPATQTQVAQSLDEPEATSQPVQTPTEEAIGDLTENSTESKPLSNQTSEPKPEPSPSNSASRETPSNPVLDSSNESEVLDANESEPSVVEETIPVEPVAQVETEQNPVPEETELTDTSADITDLESQGAAPQNTVLTESLDEQGSQAKKEAITTNLSSRAASRSSDSTTAPNVAATPDSEALPADGWTSYNNYLSTSLQYPVAADTSGITGTVQLRFTVDQNGAVSNIVVIKGLGYGCDQEAIRLVENGPSWTPAQSGGSPSESQSEITVTFQK